MFIQKTKHLIELLSYRQANERKTFQTNCLEALSGNNAPVKDKLPAKNSYFNVSYK